MAVMAAVIAKLRSKFCSVDNEMYVVQVVRNQTRKGFLVASLILPKQLKEFWLD